jgi:hypothetical protein
LKFSAINFIYAVIEAKYLFYKKKKILNLSCANRMPRQQPGLQEPVLAKRGIPWISLPSPARQISCFTVPHRHQLQYYHSSLRDSTKGTEHCDFVCEFEKGNFFLSYNSSVSVT